jgi:hypothetical protein
MIRKSEESQAWVDSLDVVRWQAVVNTVMNLQIL